MQVKRYFAADMRQAMNRVREELGADAAIISTRRVAGGVELTAALDYQAPPAVTRPNPALEAELRKTQAQIIQAHAGLQAREEDGASGKERQLLEQVMQRVSSETAPAAYAQQSSASQGEMAAMRSELNSLRELLEMQLGNMACQVDRVAGIEHPAENVRKHNHKKSNSSSGEGPQIHADKHDDVVADQVDVDDLLSSLGF